MRVLVAEDDPVLRQMVMQVVRAKGHEPVSAADGAEAWSLLCREPIEVVISDWCMPQVDGLELCRRLRRKISRRYTYFIMMTGQRNRKDLQSSLAEGADDYVTKPIDVEELSVRLDVAERISTLEWRQLDAEDRITFLEEQARSRTAFAGMVGKSLTMQELYRRIRLAASSEASVLLFGESGTGKELAARAIHSLGPRREAPFVAFGCGALPESILESELFGHVRGAFTGAVRSRPGLLRMADGGTLFLDEIEDVSPALQQKLLRALDQREVRPLGEGKPIHLDFRLITASNQNLSALVGRGAIREDFYYRIRVFQIDLPPLRDRMEDVPLLIDHFVEELSRSTGRRVTEVEPEALAVLLAQRWKGNVRELRNALEHAFVVVQGSSIRVGDLPPELLAPEASGVGLVAPPPSAPTPGPDEIRQVLDALREAGGNKTRAARLLGMSRVGLWKKMKRLGLARTD